MKYTKTTQNILLFSLACLLLSATAVEAKYGKTSTWLSRPYYDNVAATAATFDFPEDMEYSSSGYFVVADTYNHAIRKVTVGGDASTIAGGQYGGKNGSASSAEFAYPHGVGLDGDTIYVADTENGSIRKITSGSVSTIVSGLDEPVDVAPYGSYIYFVDAEAGKLYRTTTSGGSQKTIASGLDAPQSITIVAGGSYALVAEDDADQVVRIDLSSGTRTVVAGSGSSGSTDGSVSQARFKRPRGIFIHDDYTLYVADGSETKGRIRRIELTNSEGIFGSDFSGSVETLVESAGGLGELIGVGSVYVDGNDLYALSTGTSAIQQFDLSELPKNDERFLDVEHIAGASRFNVRHSDKPYLVGQPKFMVMSENEKWIYVAENNRIVKVRRNSKKKNRRIELVAGNVVDNYNVTDDETYYGEEARFSDIPSFALSKNGENLIVVDRNNNRIRKINIETGGVTYLTGAGEINSDSGTNNGFSDGVACPDEFETGVSGCAYFNRPMGSAFSKNGKFLFVADSGNDAIRRVTVKGANAGKVVTIAGTGSPGYKNGKGTNAQFDAPIGLALSKSGKQLFVADRNNHVIRKIRLKDKKVTTLAGTGDNGYLDAKAEFAQFSYPEWVHAQKGKVFVSEVGGQRIRLINLNKGLTKLVAGSGDRGYNNAGRKKTEFNNPRGMLVVGNKLLVAELRNDTIRSIDVRGAAPFAEDAPVLSSVVNNDIKRVWFSGSTASIEIRGSDFRHGMTTYIGPFEATNTYVNSESVATIELPISEMPEGYYDITVENTDGQTSKIERGLTFRDDWQDPSTHYTN